MFADVTRPRAIGSPTLFLEFCVWGECQPQTPNGVWVLGMCSVSSIRAAVAGLELILWRTVKIRVVWVPGHAGIQGNEAAHRLARASLSYPSAGQPLIRLLGDSTSGSDTNTDTSPPPYPRTEARRRLSTRLLECAVPIPRGYPRATEVQRRRIATGCTWTPHRLARFGLRTPEHAGCDRCCTSPTSPQAERTVDLTPDTASNNHPSAPLTTLRHLLWECSEKKRQEREAALAKLSPASRPKTLEAWTTPTGLNEARKLVFDSLLAYIRTAGVAGLI
ncbi:hypothetical protein HPB47_003165 [Ixodes persulcatus]|uniref:Uncharacterized protein n=1 Tax=Ixodes persulcatus TaxID=34615 RepID=A0AC60PJ78_IXOPE|nr:hypothetical protein HPB47_003165 [Ixodes persulcatus]